jgi:hypothetical protein
MDTLLSICIGIGLSAACGFRMFCAAVGDEYGVSVWASDTLTEF